MNDILHRLCRKIYADCRIIFDDSIHLSFDMQRHEATGLCMLRVTILGKVITSIHQDWEDRDLN